MVEKTLQGFPVVEVDNLPAPTVTFGDWSKYIGVAVVNETTPIGEACDVLGLDGEDRTAILALPAVRTLGDLRVVLERGEVEKALAQKLKKALKP